MRHPLAHNSRILLVWFTLGGMILGYFLVHPFAMLVYVLDPQHPHASLDLALWGRQVRMSFSPEMLAMGLAFILMGGLTGFILGAWRRQRELWMAAELESQRRQAALETLKDLMVTLAHYIRNANLVIGGFSARLGKDPDTPEIKEQLGLIHHASREIDAVLRALENLTEVSAVQYIREGQARMIDLKRELEAHLAGSRTAGDNQHGS